MIQRQGTCRKQEKPKRLRNFPSELTNESVEPLTKHLSQSPSINEKIFTTGESDLENYKEIQRLINRDFNPYCKPIGKSYRKRCTTNRDNPKGVVVASEKRRKQANENVSQCKVVNDEINTTDFSKSKIVFPEDNITDTGEDRIYADYNNHNGMNIKTVIATNNDQHDEYIKYNLRRNPKKSASPQNIF